MEKAADNISGHRYGTAEIALPRISIQDLDELKISGQFMRSASGPTFITNICRSATAGAGELLCPQPFPFRTSTCHSPMPSYVPFHQSSRDAPDPPRFRLCA